MSFHRQHHSTCHRMTWGCEHSSSQQAGLDPSSVLHTSSSAVSSIAAPMPSAAAVAGRAQKPWPPSLSFPVGSLLDRRLRLPHFPHFYAQLKAQYLHLHPGDTRLCRWHAERRGRNYQPAEVPEADVELMPTANISASGAVTIICRDKGVKSAQGPALWSCHGYSHVGVM